MVGFLVLRRWICGLCPPNTQDLFKEKRHTNHQEESSEIKARSVDDCGRKAVNELPRKEFDRHMILEGLAELASLGRFREGFEARAGKAVTEIHS